MNVLETSFLEIFTDWYLDNHEERGKNEKSFFNFIFLVFTPVYADGHVKRILLPVKLVWATTLYTLQVKTKITALSLLCLFPSFDNDSGG